MPWSATRPGRPCRTSGCPRGPTLWAVVSPSCVGWFTQARTAPPRPRSVSSWRRCGRCSSLRSRALPTSSRSPSRPVTRSISRMSYAGWRQRPTTASTWSSGAASSRSVAASSTCSRRPTSIRCGWSSGATRSRRSGPSPSQTNVRSTSRGRCGRRRAASSCSPTTSGAVRASWPPTTPSCARCSTSWPKAMPWRAWSPSRRSWSTTWSCSSTCCRRGRWCWCATPSGCGRGRTTWSRPARSSSTPPGPRPPEGDRHRSTWAQRHTAPSVTSAPTRSTAEWPGGASVRSVSTPKRRRSPRRRCARRPASSSSSTSTCPAPSRPERSTWSPSPPTGVTRSRPSTTSEAGSRTADGSSWSPRAMAPVNAWSRCSPSTTSPRAWSRSSTTTPRPAWSRWCRAASATGWWPRRSASSCSPATT